jgi:hypothetical protein
MKLEMNDKVAVGILGLYVLYGLFAIPFAYFMISLAVGLIVYGAANVSLGVTVAIVLITGAVAQLIGRAKPEGFQNGGSAISARVKAIKRAQPAQTSGVFASGFVEAFEDISEETDETKKKNEEKAEEKFESPSSKPAPAKSEKPTEAEGLFKLGQLPTESKGGFHIDQGTTVLNALNALQPDQVKKMSEDTQKLIDTQKSLMMMLGTMKPMLSDGKQLIDTFQQMFGPGALNAAGGVAANPLAGELAAQAASAKAQ